MSKPFPYPPSPEQKVALDLVHLNEQEFRGKWTRRNIIIKAGAGSGKTSLNEMIIDYLLSQSLSVAYVMFNKATIEEMKARIIAREINSQSLKIATGHSFGYQAFKNYMRGKRFAVVQGKTRLIYRDLFRNHKTAYKVERQVIQLVSSAKTRGMGIPMLDPHAVEHGIAASHPWWEEIINHFDIELDVPNLNYEWLINAASAVLEASNRDRNTIDFDDEIYLPLLLNAPFDRYDYVLVDEAQDSNAIQREVYSRMVGAGGALVATGDELQAIYGFNGADNDAMAIFQSRFAMVSCPLDVCFRCAKAIVEYSRPWFPQLKVWEHATQGKILNRKYEALFTTESPLFTGQDAILCRKNAPLMRLAFKLIHDGVGCRVEGRDIGLSFVRFVETLTREADSTLRDLQSNLYSFEDYEVRKLRAKGEDEQVGAVQDKCAAMDTIIKYGFEKGLRVEQLKDFIQSLFSDKTDPDTPKDVVTLSSIHKAKGKEWDRVFLLGRKQFQPSPFAKSDWAVKQEGNLIGIAITRAKTTLVEITNVPE